LASSSRWKNYVTKKEVGNQDKTENNKHANLQVLVNDHVLVVDSLGPGHWSDQLSHPANEDKLCPVLRPTHDDEFW
jgi:hypothetical protein